MPDLNARHQRNLDWARGRVAALVEKNPYEMDQRELRLWLTRMEDVAQDLLAVVDTLLLTNRQTEDDDPGNGADMYDCEHRTTDEPGHGPHCPRITEEQWQQIMRGEVRDDR